MLELTPAAAEVVKRIVSQTEPSETAGMRITSHGGHVAPNGSAPARDIHLSVVEGPQGDDQIVEGAPVYVESGQTADMLEDKILDAKIDSESVEFRLLQESGPPDSAQDDERPAEG